MFNPDVSQESPVVIHVNRTITSRPYSTTRSSGLDTVSALGHVVGHLNSDEQTRNHSLIGLRPQVESFTSQLQQAQKANENAIQRIKALQIENAISRANFDQAMKSQEEWHSIKLTDCGNIITQFEEVLLEKDALLAQQGAVLVQQGYALAEKDAEILRLKALLTISQARPMFCRSYMYR